VGEVGLNDVDETTLEELTELAQGMEPLTRGDRQVGGRTNPPEPRPILRAHGLLDPRGSIGLDGDRDPR
jgi:hypothetical protein